MKNKSDTASLTRAETRSLRLGLDRKYPKYKELLHKAALAWDEEDFESAIEREETARDYLISKIKKQPEFE